MITMITTITAMVTIITDMVTTITAMVTIITDMVTITLVDFASGSRYWAASLHSS